MQDQAGPFAGCPPRSRSVAEMDGCSRQNPAYRLATGKAPGNGGLSYLPVHHTFLTGGFGWHDAPRARFLAGGVSAAECGGVRRTTRSDRGVRAAGALASSRLPSRPLHANMCSIMVVCVLLPRFALTVAAGGRAELARGPVALAPEPGREPLIGEASAAAEAQGVKAGLRLGEALARCPSLRLI